MVKDDDTGESNIFSLVIPVINSPPKITAKQLPSVIDEGQKARLEVTFEDLDADDLHTAIIDWGDGPPMTVSVPKGGRTIDETHPYPDDDPTGTAEDQKNVTITINDGSDSVEAAMLLTVKDVAPTITLTPLDPVIDEGGTVRLTVNIDDPGKPDTFDVEIDWGGAEGKQSFTGVGGSFSTVHLYRDDDPTGTPQDTYTITATIVDDDTLPGLPGTATVTVRNVAPVAGQPGFLPSGVINENESVVLRGSFTDVGALDTFKVTIQWPDGLEVISLGVGERSYVSSLRRFPDDGPSPGDGIPRNVYPISVTITDDDAGSGNSTTSLTVANLDPTVAITASSNPVKIREPVVFTATWTDPSPLETMDHFEWAFGDGTTSRTNDPTVTHSYETESPSYIASVIAVDDDTGRSKPSSVSVRVTKSDEPVPPPSIPYYDVAFDAASGVLFFATETSIIRIKDATRQPDPDPARFGFRLPPQVSTSTHTGLFFLTDAITLGGKSVPAGSLLVINGDQSRDKVFAISATDGTILASLELTQDYEAVGIVFHKPSSHLFLLTSADEFIQVIDPVTQQLTSRLLPKHVVEIDPKTGSELRRFDVPLPLRFSSGGIAINPTSGNLVVAADTTKLLYELDLVGNLVRSFDTAELGLDNELSGLVFTTNQRVVFSSTLGFWPTFLIPELSVTAQLQTISPPTNTIEAKQTPRSELPASLSRSTVLLQVSTLIPSERNPALTDRVPATPLKSSPVQQSSVSASRPVALAGIASQPSILNGAFNNPDVQQPGFGWTVRGDVKVVNGAAVLTEGSETFANLRQRFVVPRGNSSLKFTIRSATFEGNVLNPPDAFEVALYDPNSGERLIGRAVGLAKTDASFSLQSNKTVFFAREATVPGLASSGGTLSLDGQVTVTLSLASVTAGALAEISFELIGFSASTSVVVIDDVQFVTGPPAQFSLDDASDSGVKGDDLTNIPVVGLAGITVPGVDVLLDVDGDGFDDGSVSSDTKGSFTFGQVKLNAGGNTLRVQVWSPEGVTIVERTVSLDRLAPKVTGWILNGGEIQRSMVKSVEIVFSEDVSASLKVQDLVIRNLTTGADVPAADMVLNYDKAANRATWTFPALTGGSLADGNYRATLRADGIFDAASNPVAVFAADPQRSNSFEFFRYYGDLDADRDVDALDLYSFSRAIRKRAGELGFVASLDFNSDGEVGDADLASYRKHYLTRLP
ncbi:MAG: PKD domain-containing protein [Pedosphaera sp.]|nr:PKD domain-containing protein [Pedosphaera sp.]